MTALLSLYSRILLTYTHHCALLFLFFLCFTLRFLYLNGSVEIYNTFSSISCCAIIAFHVDCHTLAIRFMYSTFYVSINVTCFIQLNDTIFWNRLPWFMNNVSRLRYFSSTGVLVRERKHPVEQVSATAFLKIELNFLIAWMEC